MQQGGSLLRHMQPTHGPVRASLAPSLPPPSPSVPHPEGQGDPAELKGPRTILRIRPGISDFEPDFV